MPHLLSLCCLELNAVISLQRQMLCAEWSRQSGFGRREINDIQIRSKPHQCRPLPSGWNLSHNVHDFARIGAQQVCYAEEHRCKYDRCGHGTAAVHKRQNSHFIGYRSRPRQSEERSYEKIHKKPQEHRKLRTYLTAYVVKPASRKDYCGNSYYGKSRVGHHESHGSRNEGISAKVAYHRRKNHVSGAEEHCKQRQRNGNNLSRA